MTINGFSPEGNLSKYRENVVQFIRINADHLAIRKLKHNKPLTASDLSEHERFVYDLGEVHGREQFEKAFSDHNSLTVFICSLVGLDRYAAKQAFARYLDEAQFNTTQTRFVK